MYDADAEGGELRCSSSKPIEYTAEVGKQQADLRVAYSINVNGATHYRYLDNPQMVNGEKQFLSVIVCPCLGVGLPTRCQTVRYIRSPIELS